MKFKRYLGYLKSDIAWIPEIPDTWRVKKIKFLFKVINGSTPKSGVEDYWDGDIVWVTPEDLGKLSSDYIQESERRITADGYKECGTTLVPEGSIVLSTRAPIGHLAIANVELCTNQGCKCLIKNNKDINIKYIYYFLKSAKDILNSLGKGTTFVELGTYPLEALKVCLPATKVQDEIGDFLDEEVKRLDLIVAEYSNFIELLKEKRIALITSAVTKGLNPNVRMKDSGVEWIGEIPEHWEIKKIKHLTTNLDGKRIPISAERRVQGEVPYYGATGIVDYVEGFIFDEELLCVGEDGAPFFEKGKNVSFVIRGKTWVNNHAHVMRVNKLIKAELLMHIMNCVDYSIYIKGSTRDKLNQDELNSIQIAAIPLHEQDEILSYINNHSKKIDELINKIKKQIDFLNEYKTSLIFHAVTGKIDVRGYA